MLLLAIMLVNASYAYGNDTEKMKMSDNAPPVALSLSGHCKDIAGSYDNIGSGLRSNQVVRQPRLAVSLFRLVLPSNNGHPREVQSVLLSVDPDSMTLGVTLIGDGVSREWSTSYECKDGWVYVRNNEGKQYLGDGVAQKWSHTEIFMAATVDGDLIAHVTVEAEDRVYLWNRRRGGGDGDWYLFRRSLTTSESNK
jgi:hypothetical protein